MASKRKEIQKLGVADLGLPPEGVGLAGAKTRVTAAAPRPERSRGEVIQPDTPEEAARRIADFLAQKKFV
jgi:electron transfer flavoprotein beta subunit